DSIGVSARRLGLELARALVDAGTSSALGIEDRAVLLDAVAALRRGDALLVAKRDRLGSDVVAVAMIERLVAKRGARVVNAAGEGTDSDNPRCAADATTHRQLRGIRTGGDCGPHQGGARCETLPGRRVRSDLRGRDPLGRYRICSTPDLPA